MGYQLIETISVGSGGAASIEFTGIDQTGQDLQILVSARMTGNDYAATLRLQINSDTSTAYTYKYLTGYNGAVQTQSGTSSAELRVQTQFPGALSTANTFGSASIYFANYTSSTAKSVSVDTVSENNATQAAPGIMAGLWNNTSAITGIKVFADSGVFAEFSTASLYKITA